MSKQVFPVSHRIENIFSDLLVFNVLFLWLHDWIPLGRLNDVAAVRSQGPMLGLVVVTIIQTVPFSIGLWFSVCTFGNRTGIAIHVALDQLQPQLCRSVSCLVDALSPSRGT